MSADRAGILADCRTFRIRQRRREDVVDEYAWSRDPETARFDGNPPSRLSFSDYLERSGRDLDFPVGHQQRFALETGEGVHFGTVACYNTDSGGQTAELGITIGLAGFRGRGYGTSATIAFLRYLWAQTPLRLVYLHTLAWNERAVSAFRNAGFGETARVGRDGQWFLRMEARREWWLLWDLEGRFDRPSSREGGEAGEGPASHAAVT